MGMRRSIVPSVIAALLLAHAARANNGGIFGYSGRPDSHGGATCSLCHNSGQVPTVALTGPSNVLGDATHTYTLTISGGQGIACGLDVSATGGELVSTTPATHLWAEEITHSAPLAADPEGTCQFSFDWVAPVAAGTVTLYAAGNSVDLDATTAGDRPSTASLLITVDGALPGELPPVAEPGGPYSGLVGQALAFDGSSSFDPDGMVVAYDWDFGDGSQATGAAPSHAYAVPGTYTLMLTVTDDENRTDTEEATVQVFEEAGAIRSVRVLQSTLISGTAVWITAPVGDPRLFVVRMREPSSPGDPDVRGQIVVIDQGVPSLFMEVPVGRFGAEDGIRGLAFPPDFSESGLFYVLYSRTDGATVLSRFRVSRSNPNLGDVGSEDVLLDIPQPDIYSHNGSHIEFGNDGMLYVGMGDGGGSYFFNAQLDNTLLGKLLRLDVSGGPVSPYTIPPDNPFVGPGDPLDEIWGKGLRNPYRFSFDRLTGDLYVADVGGAVREEVSVEPGGSFGGTNFGWILMEGSLCTSGSPACTNGTLLPPVHEYAHSAGRCSIIGGSLYRGVIPGFDGRFFFSDWCTHEIWSLQWNGAGGIADLRDHTLELTPPVGSIQYITAIGRDGFGELFILDAIDGEIFRVVSTEADGDGDFVPDSADNCVADANTTQLDSETDAGPDGAPGLAGVDDDASGVADDPGELCPLGPRGVPAAIAGTDDVCGDGAGNACDTDDDDDGLLDTVETNTGVYVSPTQTGSNPLLADTDGDGRDDGTEVTEGTNPNVPDAPSVPALGSAGAWLILTALLASGLRRLRRRI